MSGGTKIGFEVNELRVCFLKKIKDQILKSKKTGFCVSLLNRLIQDNSDHKNSQKIRRILALRFF